MFKALCSGLDLQKRLKACRKNPRVAEILFCFGEALRKGSGEAQMAKQMMKTKENEGKKLEMDRRKENRGGKYQIRRNKDVSVAHS